MKNLFGRGMQDRFKNSMIYGIHDPLTPMLLDAINKGAHHHFHELKHHHKPIGGKLTLGHVKNFFVNAGKQIHNAFKAAAPVAKQGAQEVHKFILNNPELAKKIKEHGSKLAGMFAKMGANYLAGDEKYGDQAEAFGSKLADEQIHKNLGYGLHGSGFGTGLYAGRQMGRGFDSFNSLYNANMGYSNALGSLANMTDRTVYGQHEAEPIKRYWDSDGQPPSRGYGIKQNHHAKVHHARTSGFERGNHYNLVRGRGSLLEHRSVLPPALQSQPYGANFNMQNMLPPQYQKYNDGTNEY